MSPKETKAVEVLFKQGMSAEEGREVMGELGFSDPPFRLFRGCITFMVCVPIAEWREWLMRFQRACGIINLQLAYQQMI